MYLGRIVEEGPAREIVDNAQHPYTRALLSVVPRRDPRDQRRPQILRGETPDAVHIPAGCRFHPRCPIAIDDASASTQSSNAPRPAGRRRTEPPASASDLVRVVAWPYKHLARSIATAFAS
jgi:oligopeptide/dipeptide ABC transporter ATP-binding protein